MICAEQGKYLGILFGPFMTPSLVYKTPTAKLLTRLRSYSPLRSALSLTQRIALVNVFILPVISFIGLFFLVPYDIKTSIEAAIFDFISPAKQIPRKVLMSPHSGLRTYCVDLELKAAAMLASKLPDGCFPMPLIATFQHGDRGDPASDLIPDWNRGSYLRLPAANFVDFNRYRAAQVIADLLPEWRGRQPCSVTYKQVCHSRGYFDTHFHAPLVNAINNWNGALSASQSETLATNLSSNLALLPAPDANILFQLKVVANSLPTKTKPSTWVAPPRTPASSGSARDDLDLGSIISYPHANSPPKPR